MARKNVAWIGYRNGEMKLFEDWEQCKGWIQGKGARGTSKGYKSLEEAMAVINGDYHEANGFWAIKGAGVYEDWMDCYSIICKDRSVSFKVFETYKEAEAYAAVTESKPVVKPVVQTVSKPTVETKTVKPKILPTGLGGLSRESTIALQEVKKNRFFFCKENMPVSATEEVMVYVDGSYMDGETAGCGVAMYSHKGLFYAVGRSAKFTGARNVDGEVGATVTAVSVAIKQNLKNIVIKYDYAGIEGWAKTWKANNDLTKRYKAFMQDALTKISIRFVKVPAHSGYEGNELVDRIAKLFA